MVAICWIPKITIPATLAGVVYNDSIKNDELDEF